MNPRTRRRLLLGLAVGTGAALSVIALRSSPPLRIAEAKSYDLRAGWVADPAAADSAIVIIAIDEGTVETHREELGRWPWDREAYDPLVMYAAIGGARAIVFDITFPEPHRHYPLGDTILAEALADAGNVALAMTLSPADDSSLATWERNRTATEAGRRRLEEGRALLARHALPRAEATDAAGTGGVGPELRFAEEPYPLIGGQAAALGVVNWTPDEDGVTRRQRLLFSHRGELYPSLALAAARVADPDRFGGEVVVARNELRIGDVRIPLDDGRLTARWHGPYFHPDGATYRVIPASHVIASAQAVMTGREPAVPLEFFRDRIVLVAATGVGAFETRATPLSSHDPGVIIHATILDNLLNGDALRRAGWPANAASIAGVALLAALLAVTIESAILGTLGALLTLVLAAGLGTWALSRGLWLDLASPLFAGSIAYAGAMLGNYLTEGRDKRRVKELFGRYVSPEYVRRLADDHELVKLGGERVPVTLLFSDIRGFTSMSEKLPAETVIAMLNEYLERMAEVVFRHGGTLDKFIGDAVMAFWGAPVPVPDHARRAADAALEMIEELERLNERWSATGAAQLRIGIGLNTGDAIVGNIGSLTRKLDYTAIGDTVNLASRLEGLTKEYGASIVISEATRQAIADETYAVRPIDDVKVKGKEQAVKIYELLGRRSAVAPRGPGLVTASLAAALLAFGAASPAESQNAPRARWTDWVYAPGAWRGAALVQHRTGNADTDSLALVARVELYAQAPRWRAEYRRVVGPDSVGEPVVLVADGDQRVILTPLGSTPFAQHEAARDPAFGAVLARVAAGRPEPAGPTRIVTRSPDGNVAYVILRRPAARADFADELLRSGTAGRAGRSLARFGMHAIGGERSQEVVASAGARGVARVQTVDGEIVVMPDTVAIERMRRVRVGIVELDRFLRDAGIRAPSRAPEPPKQEGAE